MFWNRFRMRTDRYAEEPVNENPKISTETEHRDSQNNAVERINGSLDGVIDAMTECKMVLKTFLQEKSKANEQIWEIMKICEEKPELWTCILDLMLHDKELADRYQLEILNWIIINENVEFLFEYLRKFDITECEAEWMYRKTGYLMETGNILNGQPTIYSMLFYMEEDERREFFSISTHNKFLKVAIGMNLNSILDVFITSEYCYNVTTFKMFFEFFPDYTEESIEYILGRSGYTDACELELYLLQTAADSKYGYLISEWNNVFKLKDWIKNHALHILIEGEAKNCTAEIAWLLENEFDVPTSELYGIFEQCAESFLDNAKCYGFDARLFSNSPDPWVRGVVTEYMTSAPGYYAMWGRCYSLANMFPEDVAEIYKSFANIDASRLLTVATSTYDSMVEL